jgi:hypothetical protein
MPKRTITKIAKLEQGEVTVKKNPAILNEGRDQYSAII